MHTRIEEKKTIRAALLGGLLFILLQFVNYALDQPWNSKWFITVDVLAGYSVVAVSFAIFAQGWLLFSHKLSQYRLYTSVLFLFLAIVGLFQTVSSMGASLFGNSLSHNDSMWLLQLSVALSSAGIVVIYCLRDRMVSVGHKRIIFIGTCAFSLLAMVAFALWHRHLPVLLEDGSFNSLWKTMNVVPVLISILGIGLMLYRGRKERAPSLLIIIRALIYLALGQGVMRSAVSIHDMYYLLGTLGTVIAYYSMLKGVYRLTIEDPFREQQRVEARMNYLAYHDDLTGLPNKRSVLQRVDKLIQESAQDIIGVVVFNVNRFKNMNDSLGHKAGDRLLQLVGERLKRNSVPKEEVFSLGGDEFAVILPALKGIESGLIRTREILGLFEKPLVIEGNEYHISLSAGLSVYPYDGDSAEQLVQHADTAVHHAKDYGVGVRHFVPSMQLKAKERLKLENDLRKGLERNEFYLEYQPLVQLETNQIVGMEALLRWKHPKRGNVSPQEFIPLAEESGLIIPLGEWVLRTACEQNKRWQEAGYKPICVSINLSMRQFVQPNLADQISAILSEIGLEPQYVELEITESMTFDKETAFEQLRRLKELGIFISIDDFGTGYSSLHYLKNLPIDRLKIDRSFVREVMSDHNDAAIVSTIASMAHHLELKVTAEGVENEEQLNFLKEQRCHEGQGYYFSKPISADIFEKTFLLH